MRSLFDHGYQEAIWWNAAVVAAGLGEASLRDIPSAELFENLRESVDQLLALLQVLNCDVDLVVRTKTA